MISSKVNVHTSHSVTIVIFFFFYCFFKAGVPCWRLCAGKHSLSLYFVPRSYLSYFPSLQSAHSHTTCSLWVSYCFRFTPNNSRFVCVCGLFAVRVLGMSGWGGCNQMRGNIVEPLPPPPQTADTLLSNPILMCALILAHVSSGCGLHRSTGRVGIIWSVPYVSVVSLHAC